MVGLSSLGWKFQSKASRPFLAQTAVGDAALDAPFELGGHLGGEEVLEHDRGPGLLARLARASRSSRWVFLHVGQSEEDEVSSESLVNEVSVRGRVTSAAGSFGHGVSCHCRRGLRRRARDRPEAVVLGEVARPGALLAERVGDAAGGLGGDVLVERARRGARGEDALTAWCSKAPKRAAWRRAASRSAVVKRSRSTRYSLARLRPPYPRLGRRS